MYLNKILKWDISSADSEFPDEIKKIFFKNHVQFRKKYTDWIGQISKDFSKDVDWWTSLPASRNPYRSEIFRTICVLETIKKLRNYKIEITTESRHLYDLIKLNFNNRNIRIVLKNTKKRKNNFLKLFISVMFQITIFFIIKFFYKKKFLDHDKLILINNYPTNNLNQIERHFQFSKNFLKKNARNIFFVPTILVNKNLIKVFKTINFISKKNYFFKESVLSLKDLLFTFTYPLRIKKFKKKFKKYDKFDFSEILYSEINNFEYFDATMIGLINYKFVERLYKKKSKIKKAICWLENHEQKGWNYGFRKFFPSTTTAGYQGFTNLPQLMNTIPTKFEEKFCVIPKKVIVSGRAYTKPRREFYKKLKIQIGPSFIYNKVHKNFIKKNKIEYLVILTEFLNINLTILEWLKYAIQKNKKLFFHIKKPKILKMDYFINKLNIKNNIFFCEDSLADIFKQTQNVIISGPTGATIEALGYNCKLLVPVIDSYDTIYLKSIRVPKKMYQLFNDKNKFSNYLNLKDLNKINSQRLSFRKLKKNLFEEVTLAKENVFL